MKVPSGVYITPKVEGPGASGIRNVLVARLDAIDSATPPDPLKTFKAASEAEQARRGAVVLRAARKLYRQRFGNLNDCVSEAGQGGIEGEYARRILRAVLHEWNLLAWSEYRFRKRAEVYRALDAAIRRAEARRGGWSVTGTRAA